MKSSLLSALRKYRPRENHDPLENFITEAFVWLLQNHPLFGEFFLKKISERLHLSPPDCGARLEWSTQVNTDGLRPDMVCETGMHAFVFEHKAWSELRPNQIQDYRQQAVRKYGSDNYHLILITAAPHLIDQHPDLALCWHDVHSWIQEWQTHHSYENEFLFGDFCRLLENEGMGPPSPISHAAILSFLPAQNFLAKVSELVQRAAKHPWAELLPPGEGKLYLPGHHGRLWGDDKCGFIGFFLLGESSDWTPGISVGFLCEPREDYGVEWCDPSNPDFSVTIDFHFAKLPAYWTHPLYVEMVDDLSKAVNAHCPEFHFLNHLASSTDPNRWHPIHIRMPMLELLRGTRDAEEQRLRVIERATSVLQQIKACQPFWKLRSELRLAAQLQRPSLDQVGCVEAGSDFT